MIFNATGGKSQLYQVARDVKVTTVLPSSNSSITGDNITVSYAPTSRDTNFGSKDQYGRAQSKFYSVTGKYYSDLLMSYLILVKQAVYPLCIAVTTGDSSMPDTLQIAIGDQTTWNEMIKFVPKG